jgi:hypothetical protein
VTPPARLRGREDARAGVAAERVPDQQQRDREARELIEPEEAIPPACGALGILIGNVAVRPDGDDVGQREYRCQRARPCGAEHRDARGGVAGDREADGGAGTEDRRDRRDVGLSIRHDVLHGPESVRGDAPEGEGDDHGAQLPRPRRAGEHQP